MHVRCYGNITEHCAISLKNVLSLFGDVTLMCVLLREIMGPTEMATSDYKYFSSMSLPEILHKPNLVKGVIILNVCLKISI